MHRLSSPALIIGGENDRISTPKQVKALAQTHPTMIESTIYEDGGHLLPVEQPLRWKNDVLTFFSHP